MKKMLLSFFLLFVVFIANSQEVPKKTRLNKNLDGTVLKTSTGEIVASGCNAPSICPTGYLFKIQAGGNTYFLETPSVFAMLGNIPEYTYNTRYTVSVAAKYNGVFGVYGAETDVISSAPFTQLALNVCGTVLDQSGNIHADGAPLTETYRFRIKNGQNIQYIESATREAKLIDLPIYSPNTVYTIDVAIKVNGVYGEYTTACNVTTAKLITQIQSSFCGNVLTDIDDAIIADEIPQATAYRYKLTHGSQVEYLEGEHSFRMTHLTDYLYKTTYSVEVSAKINDVWTAYGAACEIITPGKRTATLTLGNLTQSYNGTAKAATVTTDPVGLSGVSITYDGSSTAPTAAGTYAVVASLTNNLYTATNATGNLVIGKATATLTLSDLTLSYNGTAKSATVTTNPVGLSGVGITYDGSSTAPTAAGTYAVIASLTNDNYSATNATGNLVIGKATATLTLSDLTPSYNGTAKAATVTTDPVGLSGVSITYGGNATVPTAAGTYAVIASLTNDNYSATNATGNLVIGKATATLTLSDLTHTYKGTAKSATVTTDPVGLSGVSITYGGSSTAPTAAGTYAVIASLTNDNYSARDAIASLVIGKATVTISLSNLSQTYDGTDKSITAVTNSAGLTGLTTTYNGSSTVPVATGSYTVVVKLGNANYTATNANGTLIIAPKAITVFAVAKSKIYGDADTALTYTFAPALFAGDSFSGSLLRATGKNVGIYAIAQGTIDAGPNYTISYVGANFTIHKKLLTISADNKSRTYNVANPTLTASYIGFVTGETNAVLTSQPALSTSAVLLSTNGNYPIDISGAAAINYAISYFAGTLIITPNTQTITFATLPDKLSTDAVFNLTATSSAGLNIFYTSSDASIARIINVNQVEILKAGTITITASQAVNANYGTATPIVQQLRIIDNPVPVIAISSSLGTSFSKGETAVLTATGATTYFWENTNGIISGQNTDRLTVRPSLNTTYTVTGANQYGRMGTQSISIAVVENLAVVEVAKGTNIITPNGDGVNDFFIIVNIDLYPNNTFTIFDRSGKTLYKVNSYKNDWDGSTKGLPLDEGTYYYIIEFGDGKTNAKKGFITIVKD
ncbi:MAG: MBG domain-containing protein [Pelobium sp.]